VAAAIFRALMDFDAPRFFVWLAAAAGAFLVATLLWAMLALPRMWRESS